MYMYIMFNKECTALSADIHNASEDSMPHSHCDICENILYYWARDQDDEAKSIDSQ